MKYSLKKAYKNILKEETHVRVVFPKDPMGKARMYSTDVDIDDAKKSDTLSLNKEDEVTLNSISFVNTAYNVNARRYTASEISAKSTERSELSFKKLLIQVVNRQIENKITNDIINMSEETSSSYNLIEKLNNIDSNEMDLLSKNCANLIGLTDVKLEIQSYDETKDYRDIHKKITRVSFLNSLKNDTLKKFLVYLITSGEKRYINDPSKGKTENNKHFDYVDNNINNPKTLYDKLDNYEISYNYSNFINTENISPQSKLTLNKQKNKLKIVSFYKLIKEPESILKQIIEKAIKVQIDFIRAKINTNESFEHEFIINSIKKDDIIKAILYEYCGNKQIPQLIQDIKDNNLKSKDFRKSFSNINEIVKYLNDKGKIFEDYDGKGGGQGDVKGRGEFHAHSLIKSSNTCLGIEPDVIFEFIDGTKFPCSIKYYGLKKATSQTGGNMSKNIRQKYELFLNTFFKNPQKHKGVLSGKTVTSHSSDNSSHIENYEIFAFVDKDENGNLSYNTSKRRNSLKYWKEFKSSIASEHDSKGILAMYGSFTNTMFSFKNTEECKDSLSIAGVPSHERISFNVLENDLFNDRQRLDKLILGLLGDPSAYGEYDYSKFPTKNNKITSSFSRKGIILKEVYSNLYKKTIINEGGLAGHMMHPYEAFDMTPRQIIDRIKEYSLPQKIIEKVDGQNLFFTIEEDGTLMFARNKEDMTHDDLVEKFTGHPAELPFVEGGNAIKSGVDQWLSSAGQASEMEIREIFHPDGETKSFINFEIMHPDKPNQIIYDEKYIVFHSIVDFVNGRETTYSSNKSQRLEKLINLMNSGISSVGFTLASNRTVDLNKLTNIQIEDYIERIKEITQTLEINENQFLGDGIENKIKKEVESLGIDINREDLEKLCDFAIYGESKSGEKIKSKDFTSSMSKEDIPKLRSIDLTSASNALKKVQKIITPFKEIFVDLGIDLLRGVKSAYMSEETSQMNIELLQDKLQTAINDLIEYMNNIPENYWEAEIHRLRPHLEKVIDKDIDEIISTSVEGGVYDYQGDLLKVTGGFAPMNQILGAAYRDKKGIFSTFKEKFMQQESKKMSLKNVYKILF